MEEAPLRVKARNAFRRLGLTPKLGSRLTGCFEGPGSTLVFVLDGDLPIEVKQINGGKNAWVSIYRDPRLSLLGDLSVTAAESATTD